MMWSILKVISTTWSNFQISSKFICKKCWIANYTKTCVIYWRWLRLILRSWRMDDISESRASKKKPNKQTIADVDVKTRRREAENDDVCQTLSRKIYYHLRLFDVIDNLPADILPALNYSTTLGGFCSWRVFYITSVAFLTFSSGWMFCTKKCIHHLKSPTRWSTWDLFFKNLSQRFASMRLKFLYVGDK